MDSITDDQILNIYKILNRARFESAASIRQSGLDLIGSVKLCKNWRACKNRRGGEILAEKFIFPERRNGIKGI